jgi:hypothetical protein
MKSIGLFFILTQTIIIWASFSANAQDLLVTMNRDTLNCKLGKLENSQYPITFFMDNEKVYGYIHKDSILSFKKNIFRSLRNDSFLSWYPLRDVGIDAGAAHQFGLFRMEEDLSDKSEFMARSGFYANIDVTYYVSKAAGYGLKYNYRSLLGGDIRYQYAGVLIAFRFWDKSRKNHFFLSISPGYGWMVQKNAPVQIYTQRERIKMYAASIAGDFTVGYDLRVTDNVSARMKLSCNIASPKKVKVPDITDYLFTIGDYCDNMNTVNLSVGFTFHRRRPLD